MGKLSFECGKGSLAVGLWVGCYRRKVVKCTAQDYSPSQASDKDLNVYKWDDIKPRFDSEKLI